MLEDWLGRLEMGLGYGVCAILLSYEDGYGNFQARLGVAVRALIVLGIAVGLLELML